MKDQVFSVGYRRLPGDRPRRWAPWPIARTALALAWRKRSTKLGVVLCAMSVFGHGIAIAAQVLAERVMGRMGDRDGPGVMRDVLRSVVGNVHATLATFIGMQMIACAFLLAMVAAGLVAEDRRTGAMELYFSRPLRRRDYVVGKLLAAGLVPLVTLVVPFSLLWLAAVGMAPARASQELMGLLLPGLLGAVVAAVVLTTTILGLSALGERGRTVGVIYVVGMLVLTSAGADLPRHGQAWAGYLSPLRNVQTLADAALDAGSTGMLMQLLISRPDTNPSVTLAVLCLLGLAGLGMALLLWRVRTEVAG
ncbi:ABC transporter permease [Paraliomyxa miuraensis]|uniref:ABC transporter permease n=1 Tax=Paraliomyxa miuraensis TaxID=376150 RepID=UPI002256489C|nr:ABC transporter permease subunit [Paraliomyxa miuraensis]MCX4242565.1 ABC transporter permease subunit [Paraliomyxa miuraensis]